MDAEAMHRPLSSVFSPQMICRGADAKARRRRLTFLRKHGRSLLNPYQSGAFILTEIYSGLTRLPKYCLSVITTSIMQPRLYGIGSRGAADRILRSLLPWAEIEEIAEAYNSVRR